MSKTTDKQDAFPEGYEHVEERLNETTAQLQEIDEQIKNIPPDKGPQIIYKPPGFIGSRQPGTRDQSITFLKGRQEQLKVDTLAKTEADTRYADNKDGRIVRDNVREELFPNPFRDLSKEEMKQFNDVSKEIEQSQDYMDAKLIAYAAERDTKPEPEKQDPEQKSMTGLSMSTRFSMSLGYTQATIPSGPSHSQSRDRQPELDKD